MNGFSLQRDAGKGLERSCIFYNTNSQCFGKKGQTRSHISDPGLQAAMFVLQHTRNPTGIPGNFFGRSWGGELRVTPDSPFRAVPSICIVKQFTTSCLPDFTWFILHPASPARVLCVTWPAAGQGQGRGDARMGASGATLTPV